MDEGGSHYVSRGAHKLLGALDAFPDLQVSGRRVLDAGASTGGFTDCVLQRGAAQVVALDVGHGQLHPRLRADDRVVVMEFGVKLMEGTPQEVQESPAVRAAYLGEAH